jgi:hypothetical protein
MVTYRKIRLYYDQWNDRLLDARGQEVRSIDVTRNDVYQLELQVFSGGQFRVDDEGIINPAVAVDLTEYTSIVFALKTQAQFISDGDFTLAMAGFDTNNPNHNPSAGCVCMLALFTLASQDYYGEIELRTVSGMRWTIMSKPTLFMCHRSVILGTEPTMPSGVNSAISGNVSIEDDELSVTVLRAGMTTNGQVILGFLAPTGSPTEPTYWLSYDVGSFTIHVTSAPGVGNKYNFQWTLVRVA